MLDRRFLLKQANTENIIAYYSNTNAFSADLSGNNVLLISEIPFRTDENGYIGQSCFFNYSDLGLTANDTFTVTLDFMCTDTNKQEQYFFYPNLPVNQSSAWFGGFIFGLQPRNNANKFLILGKYSGVIKLNTECVENKWYRMVYKHSPEQNELTINNEKVLLNQYPKDYSKIGFFASNFLNGGQGSGKIKTIKIVKE